MKDVFCVAICEDEKILCDQLAVFLESYTEKDMLKVDKFYTGSELYEKLLCGEHYDLLVLDIELPGMSGVEVANRVREELKNDQIQILYISAKQGYVMELFAARPLNFLVKPISREELIENVEKGIERCREFNWCFEFKFGAKCYRVAYGEVLYFESKNRKVLIHTKYGTKEIYEKLDRIEEKAPAYFIRIHKSYLINHIHVTCWSPREVCLKKDTVLPVSMSYRKHVAQHLLQDGGRR